MLVGMTPFHAELKAEARGKLGILNAAHGSLLAAI